MDDNSQIWQRILHHCQQQDWYGGDGHNTATFSKRGERYEVTYDPYGNERRFDNDPDDHPRKTSFAYPPATTEQFLATEQYLGFSLPPLLKTLYARLANGGFGPGFGLMGVVGGYCEAGNMLENYQFHRQRARLIDLETYTWWADTLELPDTVWPRTMLYLCDWGWGTSFCIDCQTGKVYLKFPGERDLHYRLKLQATSLEEWFEQWLQDELKYEPPKTETPELDISDLQLFFESGPASNDNEADV